MRLDLTVQALNLQPTPPAGNCKPALCTTHLSASTSHPALPIHRLLSSSEDFLVYLN